MIEEAAETVEAIADAALDRLRRIEWWARIGDAARGLVYVAFGAAMLWTGRGQSNVSAMNALYAVPGGALLLIGTALGLTGYGACRLYEAWLDLDGEGDGWPARARRAGRAIGGLAYWGLAGLALAVVARGKAEPVDAPGPPPLAGTVAAAPGAGIALTLVGLGLLVAAAAQVKMAWTADFWWMCDRDTPPWVKLIGRVGFAARGAALATIGYYCGAAGLAGTRLKGVAQALDALRDQRAAFDAVAGGIILFGLFSLALARFRHVSDEDAIDRLKAKLRPRRAFGRTEAAFHSS